MRKNRWAILLLGLCCVWSALTVQARSENIVQNGGFEHIEQELPAAWMPGMWLSGEEISAVERSGNAYEGEASGYVHNASPNDARWEQILTVLPDTDYRFRAMVRAEGCDVSYKGANISVKDIYGTSPDVHDTQGEWVPLEFYGRTGAEQDSLTLMLRVGGYGSENIGKAWFDAVEAEAVEDGTVPDDAVYLDLEAHDPSRGVADNSEYGDDELLNQPSPPGIRSIFLLIGVGAVFLLLALFLGVGKAPASPLATPNGGGRAPVLWGVLGAALVLRLVLSAVSPGYETDVNCFNSWSLRMAQVGPAGFYAQGYFCDYPPGYLLVLWLNGGLFNLLGITYGSVGSRLILRALPVLCDVAGAYALYRFSRKRMGERPALLLMTLYAFNPATIMTSAAWGQVDAVLTLGLFCTIWWASEHKWQWALPLYALCVLIKPQALMAGPLGLLALLCDIGRNKETRRAMLRHIGIGFAGALAVVAAVVIPFWGNQEPTWLLSKYAGTMRGYDYATLNTANLFYLLGGNWVKATQVVLWGVNWNLLGVLLMAALLLYIGYTYVRARDPHMIWLCAALLFFGLVMLGMMMHERYILPALLMLGAAYAYKRDARTLVVMIGLSVTSAINIGMVLIFQHLIAPNEWVGYSLAIVNLLLLALLVWTAWEHAVTGKLRTRLWAREQAALPDELAKQPRVERAGQALNSPLNHRLRLTPRDWFVMIGITLAYSFVAFWNLGDTVAPQTQWKASAQGEQVTFDLGETRNFSLYYYGGISLQAFTVATSDDGVSWSDELAGKMDQGECFRWLAYKEPSLDDQGVQRRNSRGELLWVNEVQEVQARYLRLTANGSNLVLGEVAFHNPGEEGGIWPIASVSAAGGIEQARIDPGILIDEQNTVPERPSFMSGTYFDEIYHARTGYEYANNIHAYEWTHPPLGKLLIMLGVQVFGMTPFGWRFAGALIGVLMLPALYLLAKQLWKRTDVAAFSTLLLALDCMHFTQTRIATIDSYPVLFILLMYLCMIRYTQMNFNKQPLFKTLIPLALSGIFMGLAIASKWIGIYASVGLAVLFAYALYQRFKERNWALRQVAKTSGEQGERYARVVRNFPTHTLITLAWCVLWFVVVPALIYYFSYAIHLRPDGGLNWARFWNQQESMYGYHSTLKDPHGFKSPWYEWPLIVKPMWYYSSKPINGMHSTILAFGNPAVWWTGFAALLGVIAAVVCRQARRANAWIQGSAVAAESDWHREMAVIAGVLLVGFASQFVPWMLVPRSTFIYHYFASVPFIILCTAQCMLWGFRGNKKLGYAVGGGLLIVALALFIGFYPYASGAPMSTEWAEAMQWFKGWLYY